jgi:hypothetical protein
MDTMGDGDRLYTVEPPLYWGHVEAAYLVFSSAPDALLDLAVWDAQARRFFDTRLASTADASAAAEGAEVRIEIVPPDGGAGVRTITYRPRRPEDLALAELAERRAGGGGLLLVAQRCPSVWIVARESEDDRLALRLAMILASALLGPVLDPRAPELFGVKTARQKLAQP